MARIRTIKPDFWTDETVGECSPTARLLFIGTWNLADDHGNLERSPKQIKAQLFAYDTMECEPLIQELLRSGLLIEYCVDGKKYLHIKGFERHQKVEKKSSPRHPLYDPSADPHGGVGEESGRSSGSSSSLRKGREGNGREREAPRGVGAESLAAARATPGLDLDAFDRWNEYRTEIRKPLKPSSLMASAEELTKHGEHQAAVVQQSIASGWQGLFALKDQRGSNGSNNQPRKTKFQEAMDRIPGVHDLPPMFDE